MIASQNVSPFKLPAECSLDHVGSNTLSAKLLHDTSDETNTSLVMRKAVKKKGYRVNEMYRLNRIPPLYSSHLIPKPIRQLPTMLSMTSTATNRTLTHGASVGATAPSPLEDAADGGAGASQIR